MATTETPPDEGLRKNSISTRHLVFFVVAAAAPLTVLAGFGPLGYLVGGELVPIGYLIAGLVYATFAVGYTAMSRYIRNAGAFYAYVREGLGTILGSGAALVAYAGYTLGQIGFCAAAGLFASTALDDALGISVPWGVSAVVIGLGVGWLSYGQVNIGARVLSVLLIAEISILFVLAVAIIVQSPPDGYSFTAFDPSNWSMSVFGTLFVLTFIPFIGFEQTAVYSEEVKDPRRTVPAATYIAVAVLAFIYTFMSWVILMGIGPSNLVKVLSGDLSTVVFDVNTQYVGGVMTDLMQVLVVTSFIAGVLALQNAGSRYLFSMGRDRLLPTALGRANPRTGSPATAAVVQTVIVVVAIAGSAVAALDPYTEVVIWTNTPTLIAVLALQVLTSVAVIAYFSRVPNDEDLWHRLVAPALATLMIGGVLVLVCNKMGLLTGLGTGGNLLICLPLVVAFVVGVVRGAQLRDETVEPVEETA